ncbi:CCAAT/enhancer-binding protein epsilon-like [Mobula hypostoma]|uniref:CCAAT/enhancer-binding protein epsilon-like n=1 Tax=Mobula hypostoma TaxID=723540 RepID=UPI002FC3B287
MSTPEPHLYNCSRGPGTPQHPFGTRGEAGLGEAEASIDLAGYVMEGSEEFLSDLFSKQERLKAEVPPFHYPFSTAPQPYYTQPYGAERKVGGRLAYEAGLPPVKEEPGDGGAHSLTPAYQALHYQVAHVGQTNVQLGPGSMTGHSANRLYKAPVSVGSAAGPCPPGMRERLPLGGKTKKAVNKDSVEYRLRRERNNIAVRKSRDKAKRRNLETQQKALEFMSENERLRSRVEQLTQELETLRGLFRQLPEAGATHSRP